MERKQLGNLLVQNGIISSVQLEEVLNFQKKCGGKLIEILLENNYVNEKQMANMLEHQLGIPFIDLSTAYFSADAVSVVSFSLAEKHGLVPVKTEKNILHIAMEDPLDFIAVNDIMTASGMKVFPMLAVKEQVRNAINRIYGKDIANKAIEDFNRENSFDESTKNSSKVEVNSAPVVRLVDLLIRQAVGDRSSDIHIEPMADNIRVRFRIDGMLQNILNFPVNLHGAVTTRIKIMGGMNIAEKRLPQDGRFEMAIDKRNIDVRVSIIPTVYGEKSVLRILDRTGFFINKNELGLTKDNMKKFRSLIKKPYGMVLVTGPTGSGKTTTIYTMVNEMNQEYDNIITIEDPVEYLIPGINQVQINTKAGLDFALGLRALLRQDPDIIMIGEIRDCETAKIAIRAAITGHFVLSTLHTNDSVSAISRLMDMDVPPYLLSASLVGIVSQRLVRKVCSRCKDVYIPSRFHMDMIGLTEQHEGIFYYGKGCPSCKGTGYKGRTGIFEILEVSKLHRDMINKRADIDSIREYSIKEGMTTLKQEIGKKVSNSETTFEEAARIIFAHN